MESANGSSFNPFNSSLIQNSTVSPVAHTVKSLACNSGDQGSIPGSGRSTGEGVASHSYILAWETQWTEEPGRLQSMESQRVRQD